MKSSHLLFPAILFFAAIAASVDTQWQYGRIVDVQKTIDTRTKAWVVNTPISDEVTVYTIWVHLKDALVAGRYEVSPELAAPPPEWKTKYPVKVRIRGDTMDVRGPTAEVTLHVIQRKSAGSLLPLTTEEKKQLDAENNAPPESLIGFSKQSKSAPEQAPPPEEVAAAAPTPENNGSVTVRSTPYLSEVFVDGESMGYTPAKIKLPAGKHTFRVEKAGYKAWTKEMTLTVGSELNLDASLERK